MRVACGAAVALLGLAGSAEAHVIYFRAFLAGNQVVPPTDSPATGRAFVVYDEHRGLMDLELTIQGIGLADLYAGGPNDHSLFLGLGWYGQESDYVVDLQWSGAQFFEEGSRLRFTVQDLLIGGQQGEIWSDLASNHNALMGEDMYIELLTNAYPGGEIRGQLRHSPRDFFSRGLANRPGDPGPVPAPGAFAILLAASPWALRRRGARAR